MAHFCGACFFFSSRSERVMREKVERKEEANAAAATPTPTLWGLSTTTTMKKKPSLFSLAEAHSSSLCLLLSAHASLSLQPNWRERTFEAGECDVGEERQSNASGVNGRIFSKLKSLTFSLLATLSAPSNKEALTTSSGASSVAAATMAAGAAMVLRRCFVEECERAARRASERGMRRKKARA